MRKQRGRRQGGNALHLVWMCVVMTVFCTVASADAPASMPSVNSDNTSTAVSPSTAAELPDPARSLPPATLPESPVDGAGSADSAGASMTSTPAPGTADGAVVGTQTLAVSQNGDLDNPEKLPLKPSGGSAAGAKPGRTDGGSPGGLWQILPALVLVLALLAGCTWVARKYLPGFRRLGGSPSIRLLGRTHLSPRQSVMLIKVGRRVLVVGASGDRLTALESISDPAEVSELVGQAEAVRPNSASSEFRQVLQEADNEFGPLDEADGPAAVVSLSGQEGGGDADVGRVRSELDQLRRKVREAMK